jgi:hypothetical protein
MTSDAIGKVNCRSPGSVVEELIAACLKLHGDVGSDAGINDSEPGACGRHSQPDAYRAFGRPATLAQA